MKNKELIEEAKEYAHFHRGNHCGDVLNNLIKALQDAEVKILARDAEINSLQKLLYVKNEEINRLKAEVEAKEHSIVKRARERDDYRLLSERQLKTIQELKAKLSEQVDYSKLINCLEDAITGMEWRIDNQPTIMDKSDYEKLDEWKLVLQQFKKERE